MTAAVRLLILVLVIGTRSIIAAPLQDDESLEPWERMDYGPFLSTAVGIGDDRPPVHKGIVIPLRTVDGEATTLNAIFDTDLLAWRCVWEGTLALRGIVFDGPHGTYPLTSGGQWFRTNAIPGFAVDDQNPVFNTDPRDQPWGPIPSRIGRWHGLHLDGHDVILEYSIGDGAIIVHERVWVQQRGGRPTVFVREITTSSERTSDEQGLRMLLYQKDPDDSPLGLATKAEKFFEREGASVRVRMNDTTVVALTGNQPPRDRLSRVESVEQAKANAAPRWGDPLVTKGVIDIRLDDGNADRRVAVPARNEEQRIPIVESESGPVTLMSAGESVKTASPAVAVIVRHFVTDDRRISGGAKAIGWWPSDSGSGTHERNEFTGARDLELDGVTWRRGVNGRSLDFDGEAAAWLPRNAINAATSDFTVSAWISTTSDGTVFSVAPEEDSWAPDGVTLFIRNGQLTFDVGWVGAVAGGPTITDGWWHHVAASWQHEDGDVQLFVNGALVAQAQLPLTGDGDTTSYRARFGWTNADFPATSRFSGYMDGPFLVAAAIDDESTIAGIAGMTGDALVEGTVVRVTLEDHEKREAELRQVNQGTVALVVPSSSEDGSCTIMTRRGARWAVLEWAERAGSSDQSTGAAFRIDQLTWPDDNPFHSWMRFGAFDFLSSTSAVITTWSGDVWRVDGLDEDLDTLTWTRMATGLNQPFGVVAEESGVLVLGRDQITRLRFANDDDGEADFYENFNNQHQNSEHFHEPASGLLRAPDGRLLYQKAARHAKLALHDQHGTVVAVSPDGTSSTVVARGFRAPIGLLRLPDGSLMGSDQEGHWMPANRINLIRPSQGDEQPRFYGNGWSANEGPVDRIERQGESVQDAWPDDAEVEPPLCWLHPTFDRSPSSQVLINHEAWGPLNGHVLGLSYGTGELYVLLRDDVARKDGTIVAQGGAVKLGVQLPTGLLDGQVHPGTGDVYVCGLFGWSSDQTQPGGFYRIRPNAEQWSESLNVPIRMRADTRGLELEFMHELDPTAVSNIENWSAQAWNYKRDADYGSAEYALDGRVNARTTLAIEQVRLGSDGRTVNIDISGFQPAMQIHVDYDILDARNRAVSNAIHLTIHALHD